MTKREFDAATRENWGGPFMASDEREAYRAERLRGDRDEVLRPGPRGDLLARRAAYSRATGIPALSRGSKFCAPALYRAGRR